MFSNVIMIDLKGDFSVNETPSSPCVTSIPPYRLFPLSLHLSFVLKVSETTPSGVNVAHRQELQLCIISPALLSAAQ